MPLNRREFLGLSGRCLAGSALGAASGGLSAVSAEQFGKRPNIILMIADDTGWNDVGYHGSEIRTPNIDQMAIEGAELDRFYTCPTCSPTRAAILMGRPPSRYGIIGPIAMRSGQSLPVGKGTLASLLREAGYATAQIGKWHLGLTPELGPSRFGFEQSYGYLHGQIDQYEHIYKNGDRSWHRNGEFIREQGHATDLIADEAVRRIEESSAVRPFFLYVAFSVPHYPLQEPEDWVRLYEKSIPNRSRRLYAASMTHMDDAVGRIIRAVKKKGIAGETLILWISDNGGQDSWNATENEYGGKFEPNDVLGSNEPLRGWKVGLYEGGIRVPGVVLRPGAIPAVKVRTPIHAMDLLPTLACSAGAPVPSEMQVEGRNVLDALQGREIKGQRTFYWNTGSQLAVLRGNWKLIRQGGDLNAGPVELYDLDADPFETRDLSRTNPTLVAQLRVIMAAQRARDDLSSYDQ